MGVRAREKTISQDSQRGDNELLSPAQKAEKMASSVTRHLAEYLTGKSARPFYAIFSLTQELGADASEKFVDSLDQINGLEVLEPESDLAETVVTEQTIFEKPYTIVEKTIGFYGSVAVRSRVQSQDDKPLDVVFFTSNGVPEFYTPEAEA